MINDEKNWLLNRNVELLDKNMEILHEVSEKHEKVRERALEHIYHLIVTIGIVAGFGFTALPSVRIVRIFFSGEILLFAAMAVGMWFARAGFIDEIEFLSEWHDEVNSITKDRMNIAPTDSVDQIKQKMEAAKTKELSIFKDKVNLPNFNWLKIIFWLFICGGSLLLLSFLNLPKFLSFLI